MNPNGKAENKQSIVILTKYTMSYHAKVKKEKYKEDIILYPSLQSQLELNKVNKLIVGGEFDIVEFLQITKMPSLEVLEFFYSTKYLEFLINLTMIDLPSLKIISFTSISSLHIIDLKELKRIRQQLPGVRIQLDDSEGTHFEADSSIFMLGIPELS